MKELTKVFNGINIPIEIIDDENMYFDISGISKKYGKNSTDWKNSKRVKELLRELGKSNSLSSPLINDKIFGITKIHNSLFVNFARFISVEFEIASNKIIMDIILGEKNLCDVKYDKLLLESKQKENQLLIAQNETIEAKRKIYAHPRNNGFETVSRIISDYNINMTSYDLNQLLVSKGLLSVETVEVNHYKGLQMSGNTPLVHADTVIKIVDDEGFGRGLGYIDTHETLF